jgi:hypothetical protein
VAVVAVLAVAAVAVQVLVAVPAGLTGQMERQILVAVVVVL